MFSPKESGLDRGWPGRIEGERVIQLAAQTLQSFFTGGGQAREHAEYPLADVVLRPPILQPPSIRDFYAFEQHVRAARASRGLDVPPEWYEIPVFYFSNPAAVYGPDEEIPYPEGTEELDYELELASVIGAEGQIAGFTVMNDWSARDLQRAEMKVGLGPSKGQGLRDQPRPGGRHDGRVRRQRRHDGRTGERRGALAGFGGRHAALVARDPRPRGAQHPAPARRHSGLGHRRHRLHPGAR